MSEARPEIRKAVETMLKKGKWSVPGESQVDFQETKKMLISVNN